MLHYKRHYSDYLTFVGFTILNRWVLRVVEQQHYGVELLPGPVVSAQRYDEVVETVSRRLCRHYNQLILEAVRLGILKAVMCAALDGGRQFNQKLVGLFTQRHIRHQDGLAHVNFWHCFISGVLYSWKPHIFHNISVSNCQFRGHFSKGDTAWQVKKKPQYKDICLWPKNKWKDYQIM